MLMRWLRVALCVLLLGSLTSPALAQSDPAAEDTEQSDDAGSDEASTGDDPGEDAPPADDDPGEDESAASDEPADDESAASDEEPADDEAADDGGDGDVELEFAEVDGLAVLGGIVWEDVDGTGTQDAGEPTISGVAVNVWAIDASGVPISPPIGVVTTDSAGAWMLEVDPGEYRVNVVVPAGYSAFTLTAVGTDSTIDSDIIGSGVEFGFTPAFIVAADEERLSLDAGVIAEQTPDTFTVTITKEVVGGEGNETFFIEDLDSGIGANLGNGDSIDFEVEDGTEIEIAESVDPFWQATGVTCTGAANTPDILDDFFQILIEIAVDGADVACTLTNEAVATIDVTFAKDAGGDDETSFKFFFQDDFAFIIEEITITEGETPTITVPANTDFFFEEVENPAGWTMTGLECADATVSGLDLNSDVPNATVSLGGDDVVCTVTNEFTPVEPVTVTIEKVIGGDGDEDAVFEFIFEDPPDPVMLGDGDTVSFDASPGSTVFFDEFFDADQEGQWSATIECSGGVGYAENLYDTIFFQVDVGNADVRCTITNSPTVGVELTIVKVAPDAGDLEFEFEYEDFVSAAFEEFALGHNDEFVIDAVGGSFIDVSETLPVGWMLSDVTCDPEVASLGVFGADVEIELGQSDARCTFTNVVQPTSQVTITKIATGSDGEEFGFDFPGLDRVNLGDGGSTTFPATQGSVLNFAEVTPFPWIATGFECEGDDDSADFFTYGGGASFSVTVGDGPLTCTVTNEKGPSVTLSLTKEAAGATDDDAFDFYLGYPVQTAVSLSAGETIDVEVPINTLIIVDETMPFLWTFIGVECEGATVPYQEVDEAGYGFFEIGLGETDAECTVTNEREKTVTVTKELDFGEETELFAPFFRFLTDNQEFYLSDGQSFAFDAPGGEVTITESPSYPWRIDSVTCDLEDSEYTVDLDGASVSVSLPDDVYNANCTFVNTPIEPSTLTITKQSSEATDFFDSFLVRTDNYSVFQYVGVGESRSSQVRLNGEVTLIEELDFQGYWTPVSIDCGAEDQVVDLAADEGATITFDVEPGSEIECVFVNEPPQPALVTVSKVVDGGDAGDTLFDVVVDNEFEQIAAGGSATFELTRLGFVEIREDLGAIPQWELESIDCGGVEQTFQIGGTVRTFLNIEPGVVIECTITNVAVPPTIVTITKLVDGEDPSGGTDDFLFYGLDQSFTLQAGETIEFTLFGDRIVGVVEDLTGVIGWAIASPPTCSLDGAEPTAGLVFDDQLIAQTEIYTVESGQTLDCVFENRPITPSTLTLNKEIVGSADGQSFDVETPDGLRSLSPANPIVLEVAPGTVILTELLPVGWAFESLECDEASPGAFASPTSDAVSLIVEVPLESAVECTLTNRAIEPATVTIEKRTTGDGPGGVEFSFFAGPDSFVLSDGESETIELNPQNLFVAESLLPGWVVTDLDCGDADVGFFLLASGYVELLLEPGDDVTCIFTNDWDPFATMTVRKVVEGDDPAPFGTEFDFWNGSEVFSLREGESFTFPIDSTGYVQETGIPAGWVLVDIDCGDVEQRAVVDSNYVFVEPERGDEVECIFVNRKQDSGVISLTKTVDGDDPGTPFTFNGPNGEFELAGGESVDITSPPGWVQLSETVPAGWTATFECVAADWLVIPTQPGFAGVQIQLGEGEEVTCEVVNRPPEAATTVTVTKVVVGEEEPDPFAAFNFFVNGQWVNLEDAESATVEVSPGEVNVQEGVPEGYSLIDIECVGIEDGTFVNFGPGASFRLPAGAEAECTFTNELVPTPPVEEPGVLTIVKEVVPGAEAPDEPFPFTWYGFEDNGFFDLTAGATATIEVLSPQSIQLVEGSTTGWLLDSVQCTGASSWTAQVSGAEVVVAPGDEVTCTFINEPVEPAIVTIVKETTEPADGIAFSFQGPNGFFELGSGESATFEVSGFFTASEIEIPGWNLASIDCDGTASPLPNRAFVQFLTQPGDRVTCTFLNEPAPTAQITIAKVVDGDVPAGLEFEFALAAGGLMVPANGQVTLEVRPGSNYFTEVPVVGYRLSSVSCDGEDWERFGTSARVEAIAGANITCTWVNTPANPATLTISKSILGIDDGSTFEFQTPVGLVALGGGDSVELAVPTGQQNVSELASQGWELLGVDCDRNVGILLNQFSFGNVGSAQLVLSEGDQVACEFVNTLEEPPLTGWITVIKLVDGETSDAAYSFVGPYGQAFEVGHSESATFPVEADTSHTITEADLAPGWEMTASCVNAVGHAIDGTAIDVTVAVGETAVCTVVNTAPAPPELELDGEPGPAANADPSEPITVSMTACVGGTGTWELMDASGAVVASGDLVGDPSGSYSGVVELDGAVYQPGLLDGAAAYTLISTVVCGDFEQVAEQYIDYIDPEGVVVDCHGDLVEGATVTLYRSDSQAGPFVAVASGDAAVVDPTVRGGVNPQITGPDGSFQWFTIAGWYRIEASVASGFAMTEALPVPPAQLGLRLELPSVCNTPPVPAEPTAQTPSDRGGVVAVSVPAPPAVPATAPAAPLAHTGAASRTLAMLAFLAIGSGSAACGWVRRSQRAVGSRSR